MDKDFQAWLSKQPVKYLDFLYRQYRLQATIPMINIQYFIETPNHENGFRGAEAPEILEDITEEEITYLEEELTKHGIKRIIGKD